MKITVGQLRRIIKEEVQKTLSEMNDPLQGFSRNLDAGLPDPFADTATAVWDQIAAFCEDNNLSNTAMSVKSLARELGMHFQVLRKNLTQNLRNKHPWITYNSEKDIVEIGDPTVM